MSIVEGTTLPNVKVAPTTHRVRECMLAEECPVCRHYLRPVPPTSLIYFLRRLPSQDVKIGTTTRLPQRMRQLEVDGLVPTRSGVYLLAVHLGTPLHERLLHERFAEERIGRTEWFRNSPRLEAWVEHVCRAESAALA